jgi:hypothetical protein
LALNKPDKAKALGPAPRDAGDAVLEAPTRISYAEGWARQGRLKEAQDFALLTREPLLRVYCLAAVAAAAIDANQTEAAHHALNDAVTLVRDGQGRGMPAWRLWRLVRLGIRAGEPALVQPVASLIHDPQLRGRAQLEVLRAELAGKKEQAEVARAEGVDQKSVAHAFALEAILRADARASTQNLKSIAAWEEPLRPFGYIGITLGLQDRGK